MFKISDAELKRLYSGIAVDEESGCWNWTRSKFKGGYGRLRVGGKSMKTHRIMWMIHYGEIPTEIFVCHHCDNPSCCNLKHLFAGTAKDNRADQDRKLRHNHGESVNTCKLTERQVLDIRKAYDSAPKKYGLKSRLGREYGVSNGMIGFIVRRKNWKHLN